MDLGSKAASKKIDQISFSFCSSFPFWSDSSSLEKPSAILDLILWEPFKNWVEWSRRRWIVRPNMILHLGHDMSVGIVGTRALDQKSRRWKLRKSPLCATASRSRLYVQETKVSIIRILEKFCRLVRIFQNCQDLFQSVKWLLIMERYFGAQFLYRQAKYRFIERVFIMMYKPMM